jgi:hypothetical protein
MPYKSVKQERFFNTNRAKLEKQGVNVDEWNAASKGKSLPKYTGEAHSYDSNRPTRKVVSRYR